MLMPQLFAIPDIRTRLFPAGAESEGGSEARGKVAAASWSAAGLCRFLICGSIKGFPRPSTGILASAEVSMVRTEFRAHGKLAPPRGFFDYPDG